jgi:hypothetical protein
VWDEDVASADADGSVSASTMDREPRFDELTFNDKSVSYHLTSTREVLFSEGVDPFFNQAYSTLEVFDQMPSPGFDGEPIFDEETKTPSLSASMSRATTISSSLAWRANPDAEP